MLATAIAVFGILADSTAVVIGAMLVAPLMFPVLWGSPRLPVTWFTRPGRRLDKAASRRTFTCRRYLAGHFLEGV